MDLSDFYGDAARIGGASWKCQKMSLLCPHTIGHTIFVFTFLQCLARKPTEWQHIEGAIVAGEDQHERRHVPGRAQIEAGITRAALQVGVTRLLAARFPCRHRQKLRRRVDTLI